MKPTSPGHGAPHYHHPPEEMHNEGVAHETSDVNVKAIVAFAGIIAAVTIVSAVIVWGLFNLLESQAAARDPKMSPLAVPATQMPSSTTASPFFGGARQPQLVTNEPAVLRTLRQSEDKSLHEYRMGGSEDGGRPRPDRPGQEAPRGAGTARTARRCRSGARHACPRVRRVDGRPLDSNRGTARSRTAGTRRETGEATLRAGGGA